MMLRKTESVSNSSAGNSNHGQLLRDIEEISKALYLHKPLQRREKSYGKWTTSFNLSGKAKGASLNVSLGFLVTRDKSVDVSVNPNVPELINTEQRRSSSLDSGATMLRRVGSVPSSVNPRPAFSSQSLDLKVCREVLLTGGLELSKSINFYVRHLMRRT
ncbi:hypothetical protein GBA52_028411 [Prunus armeniaca]|nr:hypothetical protein GBA52_028411 [Prunus armeniaca]